MADALDSLRRAIVDSGSSSSISHRLRRRRFRNLQQVFPDLAFMRVLDLGGTAAFWLEAPVRPASVVLVNVLDEPETQGWISSFVGDVCDPPSVVGHERFDLVFSNSVIEHVGGHERRKQMASVVYERGRHHWIQTPYRYFPIEPHWVFPGFQFLPTAAQGWIGARWPFTWAGQVPYATAIEHALDVELLDVTQLRYYFPDSRVDRERVFGLPKSLIAIG